MSNLPCTRMRTCCMCLDTGKGSILAAVSTIAVAIVTFVFIVLSLVYWEPFSHRVKQSYDAIGFDEDFISICIRVLWWGNIFTLIVIVFYVVFCILLIVGVKREQYKHMIPWIAVTTMVLPFFITSFLLQLLFGLIGGGVAAVWVPALLVLIWCVFWTYGYFCTVSHYRALKGDIHRPVVTIFRRDDEYR